MSNLEYLAQARKLLTEDYKTKHTNEYNSWLANQQHSWMQPHIVVPFPPFIVSSALAPFKASASAPSEDAVVAKALELYNQFNPAPVVATAPMVAAEPTVVEEIAILSETIIEAVEETVVEMIEPVLAEILVEPIAEATTVEPITLEASKNIDAIYKIFQEPLAEEVASVVTSETAPLTIEQELSVVPQPAEELAKVTSAGKILPTVLQRLRDMAFSRSTIEEKNV